MKDTRQQEAPKKDTSVMMVKRMLLNVLDTTKWIFWANFAAAEESGRDKLQE